MPSEHGRWFRALARNPEQLVDLSVEFHSAEAEHANILVGQMMNQKVSDMRYAYHFHTATLCIGIGSGGAEQVVFTWCDPTRKPAGLSPARNSRPVRT